MFCSLGWSVKVMIKNGMVSKVTATCMLPAGWIQPDIFLTKQIVRWQKGWILNTTVKFMSKEMLITLQANWVMRPALEWS